MTAIAIGLVAAALVFWKIALTPLGALNFFILQWLGVRLQFEFDREAWQRGPHGRWWSSNVPTHGPVAWSILRWVWPLTGWWSPYRWIARRGGVR